MYKIVLKVLNFAFFARVKDLHVVYFSTSKLFRGKSISILPMILVFGIGKVFDLKIGHVST